MIIYEQVEEEAFVRVKEALVRKYRNVHTSASGACRVPAPLHSAQLAA